MLTIFYDNDNIHEHTQVKKKGNRIYKDLQHFQLSEISKFIGHNSRYILTL